MAYSTTAANQALDALSGGTTNVLAFVSLHSAAPGGTGASELSGGGYARQGTITWNAASSRAKTNSTSGSWTTAGSTAATDVGTFSAVTAGTYGIDIHLGSPVTAVTITFAAGALSLSA